MQQEQPEISLIIMTCLLYDAEKERRMLLETNRSSLKPSHQNQEISIRSIFMISLALTCNCNNMILGLTQT